MLEPGPPLRRAPRSWTRAPVTWTLAALNVAVFLAVAATGGFAGPVYSSLALESTSRCVVGTGVYAGTTTASCAGNGGTWYPGVNDGAVWRLLTSAFTHAEIAHITFNLLALVVLGTQFERALGRPRFLLLWFTSALTGSLAVWWLSPDNTSTVGASGALYGLLGVLLVYALRGLADLRNVLFWLGINLLFTVFVAGISWQGHLGGFVGGLLLGLVLVPRRRTRPAGPA